MILYQCDTGEIRSIEIRSMHGRPDRLRPGDIVSDSSNYSMPQLTDEIPRVRMAYDRGLLEEYDGGSGIWFPVGVRITAPAAPIDIEEGYEAWVANPLPQMYSGNRPRIRMVEIWEETVGLERQLAELRTRELLVSLCFTGLEDNDRVPQLPEDLAHLEVRTCLTNAQVDWEELRRLTFLRSLALVHAGDGTVLDLSDLRCRQTLRHLDLSAATVHNVQELAGFEDLRVLKVGSQLHHDPALITQLPQLRHLSISGADDRTLEIISRLPHLESLELVGPELSSLTPLVRASGLRWLSVRGGNVNRIDRVIELEPLESLTISGMPLEVRDLSCLKQLRRLDLSRCTVPDLEAGKLQARMPDCEVIAGGKQLLWRKARRADRIRIWEGPPSASRERVVFESSRRADVKDLIGRIAIDPNHRSHRCMCDGDVTIEFYEDETCVAQLSLHHGDWLRWNHFWGGELKLAPKSATLVAQFLSERGVTGVDHRVRLAEQATLAEERRLEAVRSILPPGVFAAWTMARGRDLAELVASLEQPKPEIARWCLEILGCDFATWNRHEEITHAQAIVLEVMPSLRAAACSEAVADAVLRCESRDSAYGFLRAVFGFRRPELFRVEALEAVMEAALDWGLRHPRVENRKILLRELAGIPGGEHCLRDVANGRYEPLELKSEFEAEPGLFVGFNPLMEDEPKTRSDVEFAKWLLKKMERGQMEG